MVWGYLVFKISTEQDLRETGGDLISSVSCWYIPSEGLSVVQYLLSVIFFNLSFVAYFLDLENLIVDYLSRSNTQQFVTCYRDLLESPYFLF